VRAKDIAGNVEIYREPYDTSTVGTDYGLTINNGALFTNSTDVILTIAGKQVTTQMQIANDGGFASALWGTYTSHKAWQITQYGSYVLPRVVYVRYKDFNGNVSATYQDDIILDVNPPTGSVSIIPGLIGSALAVPIINLKPQPTVSTPESNAEWKLYLPLVLNPCRVPTDNPNVTLHLSATDDVSGVGSMIISNRADFSCAAWVNYATTSAWYVPPGVTTVYVKFRDNAGNVSTTYSAIYTP
jgi:hypothetical protein